MRLLTAVLFASLALVACGDGGEVADENTVVGEMGGEDITVGDLEEMDRAISELPECEEFYAEGEVVSIDEVEKGCRGSDGQLVFSGLGSFDCDDGTKLYWNDQAWWFEGEGVQRHAPDAEANVPPDSAYDECSPP